MIDTEVSKAAKVVIRGGTILYPTDTIWGIGCDATHADAVRKIFEIKQRDDSKSMLVLVHSIEMLKRYLRVIPAQAIELLNKAEKPTTIIYPGARGLAGNLIADDGSVGIRITSDPFCQKLIECADRPIVSTSANLSGEPPPSLFRDIHLQLRQQVDHVVKWRQDETETAQSSAIIKLEKGGRISILRP